MEWSSAVERRGGKEPFQAGKYLEQKLGIKNKALRGSWGYKSSTEARRGGARIRSSDLTLQPTGK